MESSLPWGTDQETHHRSWGEGRADSLRSSLNLRVLAPLSMVLISKRPMGDFRVLYPFAYALGASSCPSTPTPMQEVSISRAMSLVLSP